MNILFQPYCNKMIRKGMTGKKMEKREKKFDSSFKKPSRICLRDGIEIHGVLNEIIILESWHKLDLS